jgi:osomolarity two-component system, sensor histidine kinase SLN1
VNERKAADSKRRLTSYVFHEVRVPLNTALLAVQNMEASGTVAKAQEIEFKALEGSLSMMSKVLNDVLDFNRMDSGRFESVLRPYAFHKVMRSLFVPLQLATDARSLQFITELDKSIDDAARRALYEAMGLSEDEIARRLALDEDGVVVGDETRLRQIITNLARCVHLSCVDIIRTPSAIC